ncbi:MAG TPA: hypothetical protein VHK90_09455 [Thermoanaerobaculia bacterium]|nr:hypothetical protein [Thermoanaerobaculia bacterium]
MTEHHFEAEITGKLNTNAGALRERVYATNIGMVRVEAEWPEANDEPSMRVPVHVIDTRENGDARDIPAFVELFFHDAFLILNLAAPGSFGGVIATSGGALRVRELTLDAQLFDVVASASRRLPLADVARWYDALQIGTQQVATTPIAKALFHLLHLARTPESDWLTVLHLAQAAEALGVANESVLELLETIAGGGMPVLHPMHDDALDPRVEEGAVAMIDAIDDTMRAIVAELQRAIT